VAWVAHHVDLRQAGRELGRAPPWLFVVPALLLCLNSLLHALRIRVLLQGAAAPPPLLAILAAMFKAAFVGVVLPSGGAEVAKIAFLARRTGRAEASLVAVVVARLLELVPWGLLLVWGLAWGLWSFSRPAGLAAAVFAPVFFLIVGGSALAAAKGGHLLDRAPAGLRRLWGRLPLRLREPADRASAAFVQVGSRPRALLLALLLTVPFSLLNCFVFWLILHSYGLRVPYGDVLAVVPAADTLVSLPVTINGVGVREGLYAHLLAPWGASPALGVAVALTRWTGELGRAAIGGLVFVFQGGGPGATPTPDPPP